MSWPKLSETLPHRLPGQCWECQARENLTYWQECDERDQKTARVVVLCKSCADRMIEPHPRLYCDLSAFTPMPGIMSICFACASRDGVECKSPVAMFNGGAEPGLAFEPKGSMIHLCRSPRRMSGWHYSAPGPVTKCSGFVSSLAVYREEG